MFLNLDRLQSIGNVSELYGPVHTPARGENGKHTKQWFYSVTCLKHCFFEQSDVLMPAQPENGCSWGPWLRGWADAWCRGSAGRPPGTWRPSVHSTRKCLSALDSVSKNDISRSRSKLWEQLEGPNESRSTYRLVFLVSWTFLCYMIKWGCFLWCILERSAKSTSHHIAAPSVRCDDDNLGEEAVHDSRLVSTLQRKLRESSTARAAQYLA